MTLFLCQPLFRVLAEKPVGNCIARFKQVGMHSFETEAEAAEECPGGLVRSLGNCSQPLTAKLEKRIPQYAPHGLRGSPPPIDGDKTDLYVRVSILVKYRACNQFPAGDHTD